MTSIEIHQYELREIITSIISDITADKTVALLAALWDVYHDIDRLLRGQASAANQKSRPVPIEEPPSTH